MTYTVSLSLPSMCDNSVWEQIEPTPVDAVEAFQHALIDPDQWIYMVMEEEGDNRTWLVDMAGGPSITLIESEENNDDD